MVLNAEGKIVMFNRIAEKLTGYSRDQVYNEKYLDKKFFFPENSDSVFNDNIFDPSQGCKAEFLFDEVILKNTQGKSIPVSFIASPIGKGVTKEIGCVIVFRDITKEREIDKLKDEFVSIASHELRTPMTVINGYTTVLLGEQMGKLNPNQKDYTERIKKNIVQLMNLVNDMLNVSRLEAKRTDVELSDIDAVPFGKSIIDDFQDFYDKKNLELSFESQDFQFHSDPNKIKEVLINLLGNAYKFTPT